MKKEAQSVADKNEIVVYQPEGGEFHIEVRVENETVWLTQAQMAEAKDEERSTVRRRQKRNCRVPAGERRIPHRS